MKQRRINYLLQSENSEPELEPEERTDEEPAERVPIINGNKQRGKGVMVAAILFFAILGAGILFLPESPRFAYRQGRVDEARNTIAKLAGLAPDSRSVNNQITEIRVKLDEERAGVDTKWYEIFTGPKMFYRTMLGVVLQAGQQLTGANFFFVSFCPGRVHAREFHLP